MTIQFQNIIDESWDYLIILDACRYDYFAKLHKKFFEEKKLEKRKSKGSSTEEWLRKTFKSYYRDVTYIFANPHIHGYGLSFREVYNSSSSWKASDHFGKIIDVWEFGWKSDPQFVPSYIDEHVYTGYKKCAPLL